MILVVLSSCEWSLKHASEQIRRAIAKFFPCEVGGAMKKLGKTYLEA